MVLERHLTVVLRAGWWSDVEGAVSGHHISSCWKPAEGHRSVGAT